MITHNTDGTVMNEKFIAAPPGLTITEQLQAKAMTIDEFAHAMELTARETNDLLTGVMEITPSIAGRLESVLSTPAPFWVNLDKLYRDKLRLIEESEGKE